MKGHNAINSFIVGMAIGGNIEKLEKQELQQQNKGDGKNWILIATHKIFDNFLDGYSKEH